MGDREQNVRRRPEEWSRAGKEDEQGSRAEAQGWGGPEAPDEGVPEAQLTR